MSCRGVHFALTDEQASRLTDTPGADNDFLMDFVEEIEEGPDGEGWDAEWVQETDKSWDAIHRCLTGGYEPPAICTPDELLAEEGD